MDQTYAPLDLKWVSKDFNPKALLLELNHKAGMCSSHPSTPIETFSKLGKCTITGEEAVDFSECYSIDKFNCPSEPSLKLPPKTSGDSCISYPITEEGKSRLATLRHLSASHGKYHDADEAVVLPKMKKRCTNIKRVIRGEDEVVKEANLTPWEHILVTVRVYHPFEQKYGAKRKLGPVLAQIINLLGEQPLTSLRDIIFCVNDHAVPGDRSENFDEEISITNKELYPSGFFFIDNTFYNDMRNPLCKDYSKVVMDWMKCLPGDVKEPTSKSMEATKVEGLKIRLGYPYVYVHQGGCEHLMVFSDARILNSSDPLCTLEYPLPMYLYKKYSILCNFCGQYVAIWILHSCDRVPYRLVHLCDACLKMYCYKNKKKVGKFLLYEYIDPSSVFPETLTS